MIPGWRARIHYWSRQSGFLKRLALSIVAIGFFGALIIIALTPDSVQSLSLDPVEQSRRLEWQRLHRATEPQPHELAHWLYRVTSDVAYLCEVLEIKTTTWFDYQQDGKLAGFETQPLLKQHAPDASTLQLWEDFIQANLSRDPGALQRIRDQAVVGKPAPTANQLQADLLKDSDPTASLAALMREATFYPAAPGVRERTLHLATVLKDQATIRQIMAQPDGWSAMPAVLRYFAAAEIGEFWLQCLYLAEYRFFASPGSALSLALFAAFPWYIILVLHGVRGRWRWLFPVLPLVVGMLSVMPAFLVATWQASAMGMSEEAPFPHDMWYFFGGVAVREEVSKLLLASLFMPWLLYKRPPGGALMIGAFVGLGFALEENINYYLEYGSAVALTRFFTANFFHAAMTGIATHALYLLLRSRFATADRFLISTFGVILAHGLYNYADRIPGLEGSNYLVMVVLAFTAWHFLDLVEHECPISRQWVSPAAVFIVGASLLMAVIFLSIAIQTPDRQILIGAAIDCVSILPVAFIYWRRLGV